MLYSLTRVETGLIKRAQPSSCYSIHGRLYLQTKAAQAYQLHSTLKARICNMFEAW